LKAAGGKILCGGNVIDRPGFFVEPTVVTGLPHDHTLVHTEAFCPIVYIIKYDTLDQAMEWNNEVEQEIVQPVFFSFAFEKTEHMYRSILRILYIRMFRPKLNIQTNTQKYFKLF
jgi:hypothetical protein